MHKLDVFPSIMDVFFCRVAYSSVIVLVLYGAVKVRSPPQTYAPFSTVVPANQDFPRDIIFCDSTGFSLLIQEDPTSVHVFPKTFAFYLGKIRSVQASQAQGTHNHEPGGTQRRMH
ncbi:unnamed protein product [Ectocarpus sp. 6 AP-2014]